MDSLESQLTATNYPSQCLGSDILLISQPTIGEKFPHHTFITITVSHHCTRWKLSYDCKKGFFKSDLYLKIEDRSELPIAVLSAHLKPNI